MRLVYPYARLILAKAGKRIYILFGILHGLEKAGLPCIAIMILLINFACPIINMFLLLPIFITIKQSVWGREWCKELAL